MWLIYTLIATFGLFGIVIWLYNLVSWLDEQAEHKKNSRI